MATPYLSALGQLEIGGEELEFGAETSNYVYLRTLALDRSSLTKAALDQEHLKQGDHMLPKIMGRANGTFTTRHYLHGFTSSEPASADTRVGAANASATAWDHLMDAMASALGAIVVGGFSGSETVGSSGGPPVDTLTANDVSSFAVGGPIVWKTGTTDKPREMGWVTAKNTGPTPQEITLLQTPDVNPQGDTLWGGYVIGKRTADPYHVNGNFTDYAPSWSLKHTQHDGSILTMLGCRPSNVKIMIPVGDLPTFEITWSVAHWSESTGGSISVQTWSYPEPEAVSQWMVRWGSASPVDLTTKSIEIEFGQEVSPLEGGDAESGVESWYTTRRAPTVTISAIRTSSDASQFTSQSEEPLTCQIGSAAGKMFGFAAKNAALSEYPHAGDDAGAIVSNLVFEAKYYTGDGGSAVDTDVVDADFAVCWC